MNTFAMALWGILMLALVLMAAPNVIRMSRGKALRNIAVWLAVFAILGLIYQNFGPGSPNPMFSTPASSPPEMGEQPPGINLDGTPKDMTKPEEDGFTPPKE